MMAGLKVSFLVIICQLTSLWTLPGCIPHLNPGLADVYGYHLSHPGHFSRQLVTTQSAAQKLYELVEVGGCIGPAGPDRLSPGGLCLDDGIHYSPPGKPGVVMVGCEDSLCYVLGWWLVGGGQWILCRVLCLHHTLFMFFKCFRKLNYTLRFFLYFLLSQDHVGALKILL